MAAHAGVTIVNGALTEASTGSQLVARVAKCSALRAPVPFGVLLPAWFFPRIAGFFGAYDAGRNAVFDLPVLDRTAADRRPNRAVSR
jgi:hypothetical protein